MKTTHRSLPPTKTASDPRLGPKFSAGFSLVEIILVIGIASTLVVGAFIVYPQFVENRLANKAAERQAAILGGIREFYSGDPPTGITAGVLVGAGVIENSELQTEWGGQVYLDYFLGKIKIGYDQLTPGLCNKLISNMESQASDVTIGSTIIKSSDTPYSVNGGVAACANIGAGDKLWFGDEY